MMSERKERQKKSSLRALRVTVLILQLGISMMTSIFICGVIGKLLADRTRILILFPLLLVLGCLAGFRSCYSLITRFVDLGNHGTPESFPSGEWDTDISLEGREEDEDEPNRGL